MATISDKKMKVNEQDSEDISKIKKRGGVGRVLFVALSLVLSIAKCVPPI